MQPSFLLTVLDFVCVRTAGHRDGQHGGLPRAVREQQLVSRRAVLDMFSYLDALIINLLVLRCVGLTQAEHSFRGERSVHVQSGFQQHDADRMPGKKDSSASPLRFA